MEANPYTYKPVDESNWKDLEKLFESKGGPHNCWCMVWRKMHADSDRSSKAAKKASLKNHVDQKIPIGLLCYSGSEPIAWCSIAPRENYRKLSGDDSLDGVWSLVCFFIKKEYRRKNLKQKLINTAIAYAKNNGAKYVEAYPVEANSPGYRFMGFKPVFEKMGFNFSHKAGKRRHVMALKL